jgi:hypothetical protein
MKFILVLAIMIGITAASNAQTTRTGAKKDSLQTAVKMNEGVIMSGNKAMFCNGDKCLPLTETYTCTDGCKVSTDGTVTKPDGSTMKLMNGYEIGKDGKVTLIKHGQPGHVCDDTCRKPTKK